MEKYYVTAVVTRPMSATEKKQISVPGNIYVARVKTIVLSDSPKNAIDAGSKVIINTLAASGLHASDFGCMTLKWAAELGDSAIYDSYPTAAMIRRRTSNAQFRG